MLAVAWLLFGVRAIRLEGEADAVIERARAGPVSSGDLERARGQLQRSEKFNPDQGPLIKEAQLLYATGRGREAAFTARAATLDEPDNLQAWFLAWAADPDPRTKGEALDQLRRLNPYIDVAIGVRKCIDCPLLKR
jgi:hypothetical protein